MIQWHELVAAWRQQGCPLVSVADVKTVSAFANVDADYAQAVGRGGWCDRAHRAAIEIRGKDRIAWLHNLTTNQVKTLQPGEGNYAFVLNVKGRILFDVNVLVQPERIVLDLDRRLVGAAVAHFNKYIIMEDVTVDDRSADWRQLALVGGAVETVPAAWGLTNAATMADLQSALVSVTSPFDATLLAFRNDFCGLSGLELLGPADAVAGLWRWLSDAHTVSGLAPIGYDAIERLRIESGIPAPPGEFNDDVLPAETGQLSRAVSFQKGCYLGQEVVERMRAHKSLAKKLVGLRLSSEVEPGCRLQLGDTVVGKLTSACVSPASGGIIGLGYVRTAQANPGTGLVAVGTAGSAAAEVTDLPFRLNAAS